MQYLRSPSHTSLPQTPDCPPGVKSSFIFLNTAGCRSQSGMFEEYVIPGRQEQKLNSASQIYHATSFLCWFLSSFIPKDLFVRGFCRKSIWSLTSLDSVCARETLISLSCSFRLFCFLSSLNIYLPGGFWRESVRSVGLMQPVEWSKAARAASLSYLPSPHLTLTSQGCCHTCGQNKI